MEVNVWLCSLLILSAFTCLASGWDAHDQLWKDIKASGYQNEVPPLRKNFTPILVTISMAPLNIIDVDEVNEVMTSSWLPLVTWTDERLQWNPENYSNIENIILPAKVLWTPDIVIFNSLDDPNRSLFNLNFRVVLNNDGSIEWNTPGVIRSTCGIDVRYFPFDYQMCVIHIESTSTAASDQLLTYYNATFEATTQRMEENELWTLLDLSYHSATKMGASVIERRVFLHRKPVYYVLNLLLPIMVLSLIALLVFWLPAGSGDKVGLAVTVVLSFTVAQDTMSNIVPKTSDSLPLISIYVVMSSVMSALSLVVSVFVLRLKEYVSVPPPRWLYRASWRIAHISGVQPNDSNATGTDESQLSPAGSHLSNDLYKPVPISETSDKLNNGADSLHESPLSNVLPTDPGQQIIVTELRGLRRLVKTALEMTARDKDAQERNDNTADEWDLVARVFDRILFIVFALINALILLVFLYYILVFNNKETARHRLELELSPDSDL